MFGSMRNRRWLQISVRTLLIGVFLLCVLLATICQRAKRQEELIRQITFGTRNSVSYAHERQNPPLDPPGPVWLRDLIGDHFFFQPHEVVLRTDDRAILEALVQLNGVESVMVDGLEDHELKAIARIKTLRRLSSSSPQVTSQGFRALRQLTGLERITLTDSRIDDDDVRSLAPLENLKLLSVDNSFVTIKGIEWAKERWPGIAIYGSYPSIPHELSAIQQLQSVNARFWASNTGEVESVALIGPEVSDGTLERLQQFKHLRQIRLVATSVTPAGVRAFRKQIPQVTFTPDLYEPTLEEAAAYQAFAALGAEINIDQDGHIRSIVTTAQTEGDADVALLEHCRRLKAVRLHSASLSSKSFQALGRCEELTTFDVPNSPVADEGMEKIGGLAEMERLTLNCAQVSSKQLAVLGNMKRLESLALYKARLRKGDLNALQGCGSLKILDLTSSRIESGTLSALGKLPGLRTLILRQSNVTDTLLAELKGSQVGSLYLRDTEVSDDAFEHLSAMPRLRRVDVIHTRISESGVTQFRQTAPRCKIER